MTDYGETLVRHLKRRFASEGPEPTDIGLARLLGMQSSQISQLKSKRSLTALEIANLVARTAQSSTQRAYDSVVRTVVEFFPTDAALNSRGGVNMEIFDTKVNGSQHPYRCGLKTELQKSIGVYVFYDSRGRALYVGKAKDQSLWAEMKSTFNRPRGEVQKISKVDHPEIRVTFKRSDEKRRQILTRDIPLSQLAHYFSAYAIPKIIIGDVESLLIRAFVNDLLNKKKEILSH